MFKKALPAALLVALFGISTSAYGQTETDTETFRLTVNPALAITAPTTLVSQVHDETDNNQAFPTQTWNVTCNNAAGGTVTFETDQAFTHTTDSTYQRDAALGLTLGSGAAWSVTTASAQTDYANSTEVVSVSAASSTAGSATFDLDISLVEETFTDLAAGDYEMTITGTLTAN